MEKDEDMKGKGRWGGRRKGGGGGRRRRRGWTGGGGKKWRNGKKDLFLTKDVPSKLLN